eukprot:5118397-Prymnesium_polylepis.1
MATDAADGAVAMGGTQAPRRLRMMEVFNHRIYKIFQEHEEIDTINDQYWTIRAEAIAPEEVDAGADDKLTH